MNRRDFVAAAAVPALHSALGFPVPGQVRQIIDGLGEVRPEYDAALLDQIRASGLSGCVVTVGNPALHGASAWPDMLAEVAEYDRFIGANPGRLSRVTDTAGFDQAAGSGRIGLLYYTQNATPIGDDAERLVPLREAGVRIVQLTYNTRNLLGDGCLERTNAGLSNFGLAVVERMNGLGLLVDVSHSGEATTLDAIRHSARPVAITHAGCRAVFDHPRNKTDQALRAMADRGGVVGILQLNPYLGLRDRNTLDDYLAHIRHAIRVAGVEHVGIGSDREYKAIPDTEAERRRLEEELSRLRPTSGASFRWPFFLSELNHPRRMETIARALPGIGLSTREVDLVMGQNFRRLFHETMG